MKKLLLPLILLILLVLEGTLADIFSPDWAATQYDIIPHSMAVFLFLIAIYYDHDHTYYCVFYGILFGFLKDLLYTDILGVYMFTYAIGAYIIHGLKKLLHGTFIVTFCLTAFGVLLIDSLLYTLYYVIGVTDIIILMYFSDRLVPTLALNLLFLMILYPIFSKILFKWSEELIAERK
ncbi:rod shape-determining protein MreD [Salirhabdus salicampi]|uniref:rod shape-determining protein MreD n=1 Tax=Salirhabdus salicampi TaxID=476102 RepID=UPI0020C27E40|nr:rod shape-determining protein MreD [Salirhabdus salicampi]MCP8617011.1 rod shape-determining protein MreD [Salirhabdus salicampi]